MSMWYYNLVVNVINIFFLLKLYLGFNIITRSDDNFKYIMWPILI